MQRLSLERLILDIKVGHQGFERLVVAICSSRELCLTLCDMIGVLEFEDVNGAPVKRTYRKDAFGSGNDGRGEKLLPSCKCT